MYSFIYIINYIRKYMSNMTIFEHVRLRLVLSFLYHDTTETKYTINICIFVCITWLYNVYGYIKLQSSHVTWPEQTYRL